MILHHPKHCQSASAVPAHYGMFFFHSFRPKPLRLASDADFIFIMCDQSMFPLYSFNDRLYVRQVDHLNHGEIGIVLYDHQILCRQYIVSDQEIILRPFNTNFPELAFSNDDETTLKPIGKVLAI